MTPDHDDTSAQVDDTPAVQPQHGDAAAPVLTLHEKLEAQFQKLRGKDRAVRHHEREITRLQELASDIPKLLLQERRAIRNHETRLRQKAAKIVGDREGTTIPGYGKQPMSAEDRARLEARAKAKMVEAQQIMDPLK